MHLRAPSRSDGPGEIWRWSSGYFTVHRRSRRSSAALLELGHLAGDKILPPEWLEHLQFIPKPIARADL